MYFFFFFLENYHRTRAGDTPKTPETPSPAFGMYRTQAGGTPETPKTLRGCFEQQVLFASVPFQRVMRIILILAFGSRHESS